MPDTSVNYTFKDKKFKNTGLVKMNFLPKKKEFLLDEDIDEQEFVEIISSIYKQEIFIYAIIPECEKELLNELSRDFIKVKDMPLPSTFPREIGYL
ncbi:hypothetical protein V7659_02950, partial [Neobacillus drentensis]